MVEAKCAVCDKEFFRKKDEGWKHLCYSCWLKVRTPKYLPNYLAEVPNQRLSYPIKKDGFYGKRSAWETAKDNDLKRLKEQLNHLRQGNPPFYHSHIL